MRINIRFVGSFAQQVLERTKSARVSGIASRGIYLQPEDDLTLYLSLENFQGPLTLNLEEESARLNKIKAGCSVEFNPGDLQFPDENITISREGGKIWHPPQVDKKLKFESGQYNSFLSLVHKLAPENPYLPMLSENPDQIPGVPVIGERILNLQNALKAGGPEQITDESIKLLGLGPGLTPLGDDFLLGILLTFNRWGQKLFPELPDTTKGGSPALSIVKGSNRSHTIINDLNRIILENSRLKTTQISASLLACAMEGAADVRLLKVLDGLCTGVEITQGEIKNLLRWGSTSGMTVLAGMISALKTKDTIFSEKTVS